MGELVYLSDWRERKQPIDPLIELFEVPRDLFYLAACWFAMVAELLEPHGNA